ncbi:hypothetical protein MAR_018084 [Mya arenaria]|uniref:Uncharacterized protein n=1 Tax=Mya arenaria TaxID=6604 RepID=A0ABY7ELQ3_MYAAR|nr:hypothetical protein MAR_018084 [Mya arenaria]
MLLQYQMEISDNTLFMFIIQVVW